MNQLKERLEREHKTGIALDIDDTLSETITTWMEELIERFGNPENLTPRELRKKYHYTQNVPYWQHPEGIAAQNKMIVSDEYYADLPVIQDALETVRKIHAVKPIVAYVSGRPDSILGTTQAWLQKHGFPEAPLLLRPPAFLFKDFNKWKAGVLQDLYPFVEGIIDDSLKLPRELGEKYPGFVCVYDQEDHPLSSEKIIPCRTWNNVYEWLK